MKANGGLKPFGGVAVADPISFAGVPVSGVDEVQALDSTASGGTFTLAFTNPLNAVTVISAAIAWNATKAAVEAALLALTNMPASGVAATGAATVNAGQVVLTFGGVLSGLNIAPLVVSNTLATGGTVVNSTTTAGVSGTFRGSPKGTVLSDTTNGTLYQNRGTPNKPTWTIFESGAGSVATADIADAAVTYAKIQNVSATDKLLGRSTAGAGVAEEIACTAAGRALLDDASAAAQLTTLGVTAAGAALLDDANSAAQLATLGVTAAGIALIDDATAGDQRTTLGVGAFIAGIAAGYKVARGVSTQVAASDTVVTGLATVVAVIVSFGGVGPTVKQLFVSATIGDQAGSPAAGSVLIKTWKPTAVNDVTPTAATDFTDNVTVDWLAIGT